jgi:hypothetical protein
MATTKKLVATPTEKAASAASAKPAAKPVVAAAKPVASKAVAAPAAKKAVAKALPKAAPKPVAAKAPAPAAKSKAPAKKTVTVSKDIDPAQRANYIEVAAFYIAERRGFRPGNPEQDYLEAAAEIDRLIAGGHFGK